MVLSKSQLGKLIKQARKQKSEITKEKYNQEHLAKDVGISRSYLGDIESGRKYPNYVLLNKIADACGVPFTFFREANAEIELGIYEPIVKNDIADFMDLMLNDEFAKAISENGGINIDKAQEIVSQMKKKDPIEMFNKLLPLEERAKFISTALDNLTAKFVSPEEGIATFEFKQAYDKIKKLKSKNIDLNEIINTIQNSIEVYPRLMEVIREIPELAFLNKVQPFKATNLIPIPVVGVIPAGKPYFVNEDIEYYIPTDMQFLSEESEYFYLKVNGDSMDKEFNDGSLVLVEKQNYVENNQIGVVLIDGMEATVKKVVVKEDLITLVPSSNNPEHLPVSYDMSKTDVHIIGKVKMAIKKY